jgi:ATP-grasp domain
MQKRRHCFVVVGYNNVRVFDVSKIRLRCREHFDADVVLLVEREQPDDRDNADEVIVCSFDESAAQHSLELVRDRLQRGWSEVLGVLPFADRGVWLGSELAHRLGLPGANPERAKAGLDKRYFRQLEHAAPERGGYVPVRSVAVDSYTEFTAAVQSLGGKAFVKPAREGNSRGCMVVERQDHCANAWSLLSPYRHGGVIVETLVAADAEFSVDSVGGTTWITAKATTQDAYRAEIQQIVPAALPRANASVLLQAGRHMCELVSLQHGAYHNEVFLLQGGGASAVETNMRPAGMRIWDLAAHAFEDFDPWLHWIRWSVTGESTPRELLQRRFAGIRQLRAPMDGVLRYLPNLHEVALELGLELLDAGYTQREGDTVAQSVRDNAAFIGHVMLAHADHDTLRQMLRRLTDAVESKILVALCKYEQMSEVA